MRLLWILPKAKQMDQNSQQLGSKTRLETIISFDAFWSGGDGAVDSVFERQHGCKHAIDLK